MSHLVCWNCGESLDDIPRPISRHATCGKCFNELHCCRLCRHYDPSQSMRCFEDRADPPLQKENANFCDFFKPQPNAFEQKTAVKSDAAKEGLASLFGQELGEEEGDANATLDEQESAGDTPDAIEHEPLSKEALAKKKLDDLFS